jgi:hypothetical protein
MAKLDISTTHADTIVSEGHEVIIALGGDDTITARQGDTVLALRGDNHIDVMPVASPTGIYDPVTVLAGSGDDVIEKHFVGPAISSHVTAFGGAGDDTFIWVDVAYGGAGDDTFDTFLGEQFTGGPGHDTFLAGNPGSPKYHSGGIVTDFGTEDTLVFGGAHTDWLTAQQMTEGTRIEVGSNWGFTLLGAYDPAGFAITQDGDNATVHYDPTHSASAASTDWPLV